MGEEIARYACFFGVLVIRISSVIFLFTVIGSLLYVGWVEADRFFNARTIVLNQLQRDQGIRLKIENGDHLDNGILVIERSEVSLGSHGSGVFNGVLVENHKLMIQNANLQVFDENPWQWVYGLCGAGIKVQIQIDNLTIKTALGKSYALGKFEIQSSYHQGLKGVCAGFTVEQINDNSYVAEGNLLAYIPSFEKGLSVDFIKYAKTKNCREINGLGQVSLEISSVNSLLFRLPRPLSFDCLWRGKSATGMLQAEGLNLELLLTPELTELKISGKGAGFDWQGKINSLEEEYHLFIDGDVNLSAILKTGFYFDKYKIPEDWQLKLSGIVEIKRSFKNGQLQVGDDSGNRRLILEEVLP